MAEQYWLETLGCPKNQVDSDKLEGTLGAGGCVPAASPEDADLVVVNTCAFIEAARQESIDTVLSLARTRRPGARLVVTGCMAERYGAELAEALPEVDLVAPFGSPLTVPSRRSRWASAGPPLRTSATAPVALVQESQTAAVQTTAVQTTAVQTTAVQTTAVQTTAVQTTAVQTRIALPAFDLLNLPRPPATAPWAYVKVAEGCDRNCGFCAIPSFRGKQRSRSMASIITEIDQLGAASGTLKEVVLVAQDLSSFSLDRSSGRLASGPDAPAFGGRRPIVDLVTAVSARVPWTRLLYLYPSTLDDALVDAILATGVPYFDLSLQHVSRPLLKRMRRWGEGDRFLERIASIRRAEPTATFRSSFIVGYPGETEADHDHLLEWIAEAQLDWVGFFPFSKEVGTLAAGLDDQVPGPLVAERLRECTEQQDPITAGRRDAIIGQTVQVLVDRPGEGRTYREAPEIDGVVAVPTDLPAGTFVDVTVTSADGPDLIAETG